MNQLELIGESVWNTYRGMAKLIEGDWVGEENPERTTRLMDTPGGLASGRLPKGTGYKARLKKRLMKGPGNLSAGKDPRKKKANESVWNTYRSMGYYLLEKQERTQEAKETSAYKPIGSTSMVRLRKFRYEQALKKRLSLRLKDSQAQKQSKASPSPSNS
jgi:hypothetical protein